MKRYKNVLYVLIGIILTLFCLFSEFDSIVQDGNTNILAIAKISEGDSIEKELKVSYNNLDKIGIKFATYRNNEIKGTLNISVLEKDTKESIYNEDIAINELLDNQFYPIEIPEQKNSKDKTYQIIIKGKNIPKETMLGIWGYETTEEPIIVNNTKMNVNFGVTYNCKKKEKMLLIYPMFYFLFIGIIEVLNSQKSNTRRRKK